MQGGDSRDGESPGAFKYRLAIRTANHRMAIEGLEHVLSWLTDPSEPSIRFLALADLMKGRPSDRPIVQAKREMSLRGWVHQMLSNQSGAGYWTNPDSCYQPKYSATVWHLQLLAMLGADGADPRIRKACERFLRMHAMPDGGFTCNVPPFPSVRSEECIVGRMLAVLVQFGYRRQDQRIAGAVRWLLSRQLPDGGWNCRSTPHPRHSSIYSTHMALWGLSRINPTQRTAEVRDAIAHGIDFMLRHRLFKSHRSGQVIKEGWLRLHFPPIHYDILNGLRLMSDLGVNSDERLIDALDVVQSKMQQDGHWLTDYVPSGYPEKAGQPSIKFERKGDPSRWITLQSLVVLTRMGRIKL